MLVVKNHLLIPPGLINLFRLYFARFKHGRCVSIVSPFVSHKAKLAYGVTVGQGSVVSSGTSIGRHSFIVKNCQIISADIGAFCSIANNVSIGAFEHDYPICANSSHVRKILKLPVVPSPVAKIGNDVWIGNNAVIKGGVLIGDGAIVGAGAVVTHNVPPYAIAMGVPAKVIKYRYSEDIIEEMIASKWWDWSDEEIQKNQEFFSKYPSRI